MLPISSPLKTIQSCWQVPYIAHFCSLFNKYLDIPSFDTEDLEAALLHEPDKLDLVPELITRLLRKCEAGIPVARFIGTNTYERFLRLVIDNTCKSEHRPSPYDDYPDLTQSFTTLPVAIQVEIIQLLCELRFDAPDLQGIVEKVNPDCLRVIPLGYDSNAAAYYYFSGTRLYKESNLIKKSTSTSSSSTIAAIIEAVATNGNLHSEKKQNGSSTPPPTSEVANDSSLQLNGSITDLPPPRPDTVKWEVICETEEEWGQLVAELGRHKKARAVRSLLRIVEENFLPNLRGLFKKKEDPRYRANKTFGVRTSLRIKDVVENNKKLSETEQRIKDTQHRLKYLAPNLPKRHFPFVIKKNLICRNATKRYLEEGEDSDPEAVDAEAVKARLMGRRDRDNRAKRRRHTAEESSTDEEEEEDDDEEEN